MERCHVLADLTYLRLKDALAEDGCALCRLREYYERRYLSWFLHEQVNDLATRLQLSRSWGFCVRHAWLLQKLEWERSQDGMATAMLWEWLIRCYGTVLRQALEEAYPPKKRFWRKWCWWHASRPAEPLLQSIALDGLCPTCTSQQESEAYALTVLTQHLAQDTPLKTVYTHAGGLCMPHFNEAQTRTVSITMVLVDQALSLCERLLQQGGEQGLLYEIHDDLSPPQHEKLLLRIQEMRQILGQLDVSFQLTHHRSTLSSPASGRHWKSVRRIVYGVTVRSLRP
jgi:hypothetical protein